ncbi:MAG TPA: MBL fold metallo-hydrolase [Bryobacteraceae bacterium]|nr:MBL fold metallo-hydrolase [Bryobacteraceae bacterium]
MRIRMLLPVLMLCAATALPAAKALEIYFVDVEGGQATLVVSPSKQALLIDTGWPGLNMRDANRIAAAAKRAGVKQIDYLVVTHYHDDHVGGVPQLVSKLPVRTFVDHGASVEHGANEDRQYNRYLKARETGQHLEVKAGDKIPMKGLDITVLTAAGQGLPGPLPGAGQPNPVCSTIKPLEADASENAQSVGILIQYGSFRMIDLGDLTWNKENELVCPVNKIGTVDLYLTTHHGMNISNPPAIIQALHPRVAVMNNGARKGGSPEAWQAVHDSPGLQDIWQLHYAMDGGKEHNSPEAMIANIYEQGDEANWLKVSADASGDVTVYNSRNKYEKTYTK